MATIKPPFEIFYDSAGRPADNAKIYIGTEGQNPETAPVSVYWDEAQTIVAKQPLRTIAGAIYRGGNKAQVYGPSRYSIAVKSANDELYSYSASVSRELSSDDINYGSISVTEALNGAIRTVPNFAALSSTGGFIGDKVYLLGHTVAGKGGGYFIAKSSTGLTNDGGMTVINGALAWVRDSTEAANVHMFGALGDGTTNDTTAIQAWLNYIYDTSATGVAPAGTYLTSGATLTWNAGRRVKVVGAGRGATSFKKIGADSGAVFSFFISSGAYLELNLHLQDFSIEAPGYSSVNGINFDAAALVTMSRIRVNSCFVGIEGKGLLVSALRDVDTSGNVVGMRFRRGSGGSQPYTNAVLLENCRANGNSNWALDYGEGSGLYIRTCDFESNGTTGDVNTGGIIIRDTVDDETGFALIDVDGLWLEANKGHSFRMLPSANSMLKMKSVQVYVQESTRAITIGAIRSATFENILAPSANAELVCEAELQNYLGNVNVFAVNPAGSSQVVGAYKTSSSNGDVWTASKAAVGDLDANTRLKLVRRNSAPSTDNTNGWIFQLANASGATDGMIQRAGVFRFQKGDGTGDDHAELGPTWFYPGSDNASTCGGASRRWSVMYAGTGTINTSDSREKQQVREVGTAEKAVALRLKGLLRAFKFNDAVTKKGAGARIHFGVLAQDVKEAFEDEGLVAEEYGVLCYDEWNEKPEVKDSEDNIIQAFEPAGNRYGVRYDELLVFIIASL